VHHQHLIYLLSSSSSLIFIYIHPSSISINKTQEKKLNLQFNHYTTIIVIFIYHHKHPPSSSSTQTQNQSLHHNHPKIKLLFSNLGLNSQQQQNFCCFINCFSTEIASPSFLVSLLDPSAALDSAAANSIKIVFFLSFITKGIEIRRPFNEFVGRPTCTLETDTQQHS